MPRFTEYEQRHLDSLDQLENSPGVQVFHSNSGPFEESVGDAPATFAKIFTWEGVHLDPELQRCFLRFDKIEVHWAIQNPDFHMFGRFSLHHLAAAILTTGAEVEDEYLTEEELRIASELRIFDNPDSSDDGEFAALRIPFGVTSPEVWYHNPSFGLFEMDLDYCGYLDALLVTKGVYGWQFLFADVNLREPLFTGVVQSLKRAFKVFPRVFPDHDYGPLEKRMTERFR
ncbi:hypothetical protein [Streptomyces sp. NPDC060035]|uniref:hypothetical protein n=1 Tax=Streptomyces sp. NPDC060035 TaxID=3347044 RepID=UPI003682C1B4